MHIKTAQGWRPLSRPCVNSNDLQGVFIATTLAEAQAETAARADAFCKLLIEGDMLTIKSFNPRMYGAYWEKL